MRLKLIILAVLFLVVLPGVFLTLRQAPVDTQTASQDTLQWRVGTAQQYQLDTDSLVQMTNAKSGGGQTLRIQVQGLLDVQTLDVSADTAVVGMRFSTVDLLIGGNRNTDTNRALTTPFRVRFVSGGIPESFEFPAGVSAKDRDILKNLIKMFQVTMHNGETWTAKESDAAGYYEAVYKRNSANEITKTKRNLAGAVNAAMLKDFSFDSKEVIQLDGRHDWVKQMSLAEKRNTRDLSDLNVNIQNHASLILTSAKTPLPNATWNFVASATPADSDDQHQKKPRLTPEQARKQMRSTLATLNDTEKGRITWIHRLRDLLRMDKSVPAALLKELKAGKLSDRTQADAYLALELAGNEYAQQALVTVMTDTSWSEQDAMRAIIALAGIKKPTAETIASLWQTADSSQLHSDRHQLVSTATYALGSIGASMNQQNDPDYPALKAQLEQGAMSASGSADDVAVRTNYVYALGNTRDKSLTGDLTRLLDDSAPAVRQAAALSLNTIGVDQAADDLVSRFQVETNRSVRSAIMESLVNWSAPTQAAVTSIAAEVLSEPNEGTRYHMAQFLGNNLDKYPGNKQILQDLLRTEHSKRIRQSVADALAVAKNAPVQ